MCLGSATYSIYIVLMTSQNGARHENQKHFPLRRKEVEEKQTKVFSKYFDYLTYNNKNGAYLTVTETSRVG